MYGVINLYKEKGITSFKQINMLKKIFPKMKIGHTGTLDPIAEGVLVVCIGKATRIADYIQATRKIYKAQMILGLDSDSYDITGQILCKIPADGIQNQEILKAINSFIGKQSQKPPIYSAKKVNGKKLYEYAYNKQEVQINESYIEITYIDKIIIENILYENIPMKKITFEVGCSKGTYIRSLCHDIGILLNNCGTMSELLRVQVGQFMVNDSKKINELIELNANGKIEDAFIPIEKAVTLEYLDLTDSEIKKYINGVKFSTNVMPNDYIIRDNEKQVIGIGSVDISGVLKGKVMLNEGYKK